MAETNAATLRLWEESPVAYELRKLMDGVKRDFANDRMAVDFLLRANDPMFFAPFVWGFAGGFTDGAGASLLDWKKDLTTTYNSLAKLLHDAPETVPKTILLGLEAGFIEYVKRPLTISVPQGLDPTSAAIVQQLIDLHGAGPMLQWLGVLEDARGGLSVAQSLGILAEDMLGSLVEEGGGHLRHFFTEKDAQKQGALLGRPMGIATVEIARMIAEPPALDIAQLVAMLDFSDDEKKQLGIP